MKTVKEIISVMTKKEQKEVIENIKTYDLEEEVNLYVDDILWYGFTWANTKQGHKYWSNVASKYR